MLLVMVVPSAKGTRGEMDHARRCRVPSLEIGHGDLLGILIGGRRPRLGLKPIP